MNVRLFRLILTALPATRVIPQKGHGVHCQAGSHTLPLSEISVSFKVGHSDPLGYRHAYSTLTTYWSHPLNLLGLTSLLLSKISFSFLLLLLQVRH